MDYKITGDSFPLLLCNLSKGEAMVTQRGGMSWMTSEIKMNTTTGGLVKGIKRSFSGNSMFLNHYTAMEDNQQIAFGLSFPGEILTYEISKEKQIIVQKNAFIASTKDINIDIHFNKKLRAGFFGGEGFILQRISGTGLAFIEVDGKSYEYTLKEGEKIVIDQGYLAAMESTVTFDIQFVKGVKNIAFGGEGLILGNLTGPGKVWLQTLPVNGIARMLS